MRARVALLAGLLLAPFAARAQAPAPQAADTAWPDRPVQVIVGWAAGGIVDTIARATAGALSETLSARFVVVNRDGAAGVLGAQAVAQARPDGYTIGFGPVTPITAAPHVTRGVTLHPDQFEFVCQVFENVLGLGVREDSPYRSIADVFAAAQARPGALTYGQFGTGSVGHVSAALVLRARGLQVVDIPFRGEAAIIPELLAGRLDFANLTVGGVQGKPLRLLLVFNERRSPGAPDVPSTQELGLPTVLPPMNGVFAPRGTPPEILARLERGCEQGMGTEAFRATMTRLREPVIHLGREAFTARVHRDWREKREALRTLGLVQQ
ncbi:MAG: tripartite tricarboxylate transporter substrate binding protein [Acetobacteraceae bacterium]|nr:tripartite tricarboxylate transporter substrate binding protein [Acetobacteraceae bacterium]